MLLFDHTHQLVIIVKPCRQFTRGNNYEDDADNYLWPSYNIEVDPY